MSDTVEARVLALLERRTPGAALVMEVAAGLRPAASAGAVEDALRSLANDRRVLIQDHGAPDIHLQTADLRVVARVVDDDEAAAQTAADATWNDWLRAFFSTHRCQ